MALLPIPASKKWGDHAVLLFGLAWLTLASLVKINYTPSEIQNREQYYAGSILFFCGFMMVEMAAISILAKMIPPHLKTSFWNAGLFSGTADTFGRCIGSFLFTAYTTRNLLDELIIAYVIAAVSCAAFLVASVCLYKRLVVHSEVYVGSRARELNQELEKSARPMAPGPVR